jgi:RNA polymerase sigma-70 factor (ECF subfamily)
VADAFGEGVAAWPAIKLDAEDFAGYLAERNLPPDAVNGGDLYLACACLRQIPAATRAFDTTYMTQLPAYVSRLRMEPELLEELGQHLREKLLVGPTPKLTEYMGKGKLGAWVRVVSVRAAIDLMRTRGPEPVDLLRPLPASVTSPELQALRNRYRPQYEAAFAAALDALSPDQREIMRLHFVDGLTLEEIGRRFSVNRSTILRRLSTSTQALMVHMRQQLSTALGVTTNELNSLTELLRSDLELRLTDQLKGRQ